MSNLALLAETENSFIRAIRADQERTKAMLEPAMRQMTEVARRVSEIHEQIHAPMQRMIESMQPSLQMMIRLQESMHFNIPTYISSPLAEEPVIEIRREVIVSRTVELSDDALDMLADKVAERITERQTVQTTNVTYREAPAAFTREQIVILFEEGKRKKALTLLLRAKGWTRTTTLSEVLDCPSSDATRKIIAGVNERVRMELGLTKDLIESKRGNGYRINRTISVRRA